jgi:hypothetical protein
MRAGLLFNFAAPVCIPYLLGVDPNAEVHDTHTLCVRVCMWVWIQNSRETLHAAGSKHARGHHVLDGISHLPVARGLGDRRHSLWQTHRHVRRLPLALFLVATPMALTSRARRFGRSRIMLITMATYALSTGCVLGGRVRFKT